MSFESYLRPSDIARDSPQPADDTASSNDGAPGVARAQPAVFKSESAAAAAAAAAAATAGYPALARTAKTRPVAVPVGPTPATSVVPLDDNLVALRLGDAWYAVEIARVPHCAPEGRPFDVVAGATVYTLDWYGSPLRDYCPHDHYASSMRRLTLSEQRKVGVSELLPTPMFVRRRRGRLRLR